MEDIFDDMKIRRKPDAFKDFCSMLLQDPNVSDSFKDVIKKSQPK
jgi:hypothetical protein